MKRIIIASLLAFFINPTSLHAMQGQESIVQIHQEVQEKLYQNFKTMLSDKKIAFVDIEALLETFLHHTKQVFELLIEDNSTTFTKKREIMIKINRSLAIIYELLKRSPFYKRFEEKLHAHAAIMQEFIEKFAIAEAQAAQATALKDSACALVDEIINESTEQAASTASDESNASSATPESDTLSEASSNDSTVITVAATMPAPITTALVPVQQTIAQKALLLAKNYVYQKAHTTWQWICAHTSVNTRFTIAEIAFIALLAYSTYKKTEYKKTMATFVNQRHFQPLRLAVWLAAIGLGIQSFKNYSA